MKLQFVMGNVVASITMGDGTIRKFYLPSNILFQIPKYDVYKPLKIYGTKRKRP